MKNTNFRNMQIVAIIMSIIVLTLMTSCGKNIKKQIPGTYISMDGQVIVLGSDNTVQYSDAGNLDSSAGTWKIEDDKIIVSRETQDGIKRHDISADIPKDKIESLYFQQVADSEGTGEFNASVFTKKSD